MNERARVAFHTALGTTPVPAINENAKDVHAFIVARDTLYLLGYRISQASGLAGANGGTPRERVEAGLKTAAT